MGHVLVTTAGLGRCAYRVRSPSAPLTIVSTGERNLEGVPARPNETKDEPVKLPLDPEDALRALLAIKPDAPDEDTAHKDAKD